MRDYELRRGHWKNIEGEKLLHLIQDVFGEEGGKDGNAYVVSYGAIERMTCEYLDKTTLRVDTKMRTDVTTEVADDTRRKYYDFLELATGYNSKERQKRMKKSAEKDVPDVEA